MNFLIFSVVLVCVHNINCLDNSDNSDSDHNQANEVAKYKAISRLFREILLVRVPQCDLIMLNDDYFNNWLVRWIPWIGMPAYSLSLATDYNSNITWKNLVSKPSGFSQCSNIVVCCWSFETCRSPNSPFLFNMLDANGILKLERRSFLFIADISTPKLYSKIWHEDESTGIDTHDKSPYSLEVMNKATYVLKELQSHITLIQRYDPSKSAKSSSNYTVLQLLTWTCNWVPGGTPVIPNMYTVDRNIWPTKHTSLKLSIDDLRMGGTVRYCTSSKSLLPMISVDDKDPSSPVEIKGLDAELIRMFQRRFKLNLKFFEPGDVGHIEGSGEGDFKGVITHVKEKTADFGIGQIAYSAARFEADLRFSPGFILLLGVVVCTIPDYLPKWQLMAIPFENQVWIATLMCFVVGVLSLCIIQKISRKTNSDKTSVNFSWIYLLGPILQRSVPLNRIIKRYSFLIGLCSWLFCCFLLSVSYSNILTAMLTFPPRESPIDSLRDLLNSGKAWSVSGLIGETVSNGNGTIESLAIERAKSIGLVSVSAYDKTDFDYAVETSGCLITEKNRAQFLISHSFTKLINNQPFALLRISTGSFLLGPSGWAMRGDIDFILQSYFDILFLTFRDFGLLEKSTTDIAPSASRHVEPHEPSSLELETIQVLFYLLTVAHILNTLVFIGELIYFYVSRRNESIRDFKELNGSGIYSFMR